MAFLEIGYRAIAGAAVEPWNFTVQHPEDAGEQAKAYEALFSTFWDQPWFAGLFLWKWKNYSYISHDDGYSPQLKPAQAVMSRWFSGEP